MALRVTQRNMYSNMLDRMNNNLSAYMKTHLQSSTQKKVNKPSDDPYGASQIMRSYTQLEAIKSYKDNLSMADGWLSQADGVLSMVDTSLQGLIEKLTQAATGSYDADQRQGIAFEVRGILEQIIGYANQKFSGSYIFGGHKTDTSPYTLTYHAHSRDEALAGVEYSVKGNPPQSAIVQFTESGALEDEPAFRYSIDSGKTWIDGSWSSGPPLTMKCGPDIDIELKNTAGVNATAAELDNENETGTWLYVRPTAEYHGDTNDAIVVQSYPYSSTVGGSASGVFTRDVSVRIDNITGGKIYYSYSTDDGTSWTMSEAEDTAPRKLYVAGGFLNLDDSPIAGEQYIIRPHRADINLTIGPNATLTVNNVGCDVFGGIYAPPYSEGGAQPVMQDNLDRNLFEVIGMAVGYLETNSQAGCQEALDAVKSVVAHISHSRATIGARMNRADEINYQLEQMKIDENNRLVDLEDADLSELMTKLAQQELAYRTVLQSSSMIMQISLINFI